MAAPRAYVRSTGPTEAPAPRLAQLASGEVIKFPGGMADDEMDRRVKYIIQFRRENKGRFPEHVPALWETPPVAAPREGVIAGMRRGWSDPPQFPLRTGSEEVGATGRRVYEGAKAGLTAPLEDLFITGTLYKLLTPDRPGEHPVLRALKRAIPEGIGTVERVFLNAPFAAITEAIGGIGDDPMTREVWSSLLNAGMLLSAARGAPKPLRQTYGPRFTPEPPQARFRQPRALPPGQEPLALPPGQEPRALAGQVGQRALRQPGPEDAEFTVLGETRTAVPDLMAGEGWRRTPGPMISPRRPPRAPAAPPYQRALPPPPEGLQFGGPLDPSAPLPEVGVRPPVPPLGPAGKVMGLPPMLKPPPASIPKAPEKPAKTPRESRGKTKYQHVDLGTVTLSDPDEVRVLIKGLGGIRKADIEGIPWWLRGRGIDFDELVNDIAKAQHRRPKEVERELEHTLTRYEHLKAEKRRSQAGQPRKESWETDVPDWVTDENLWREE